MPEKATCRGCGKELIGEPYYKGKPAYQKDNKGVLQQVPVNHYGGFVCCWQCDYNATLELEQSMPGHNGQKTLNGESYRRVQRNWPGY
jgi:hypothetical protein